MRALVTGGTGFVGGALVRALVAGGAQVRVLARPTSQTEALETLGVEIVRGDILIRASIEAALAGCDILFHAAALYDLWGLDEAELLATETEGTRNAMEASLAVGVAKVVYTSTAVCIGEAKGHVATETTVHRGYFLSSYEKAKLAFAYVDKGVPLICVQPAAIYGPGDRKPTGRFIINLLNGQVPALFPGWVSLVYIDDAARGHVLAAESGRVGERYILAGTVGKLTELGRLAAGLVAADHSRSAGRALRARRRGPVAPDPQTAGSVVGNPPRFPRRREAYELGLNTDQEEGFTRTINWYWAQGLLRRRPACSCDPG